MTNSDVTGSTSSVPSLEQLKDLAIHIDLGGDHLRQNFATILPEWAKQRPIYVLSGDDLQIVCNRYVDVMEVFRDRDRFSVEPPNRSPGRFDRFLGLESIAQVDGARHDRLRRILSPTFNPANVQRQSAMIANVITDLIDSIALKGSVFDAMQEFSMHLVVGVLLGGMLKMNGEQIAAFVAAGAAIGSTSQLKPGEPVPAETFEAFAAARKTVEALIAARRAQPGDDMISGLISARDSDDKLSDQELFDQIFIICAAALTTTAGSMGGLLLSLGRDPAQFAQVKADPALIPQVVEEGLRIHGPGFLAFARFAVMETEVGGTYIPKGTPVYCSFQAACYDPEAFPDPLHFNIHRKPKGIPIFGAGTHHCLGQVLARLIIQTSLKLLLERFPRLALAQADFQPRYHGEFGEALIVELPMTIA